MLVYDDGLGFGFIVHASSSSRVKVIFILDFSAVAAMMLVSTCRQRSGRENGGKRYRRSRKILKVILKESALGKDTYDSKMTGKDTY